LVEWFLEQSQMPSFADKLSAEYLPVHHKTLQAWLSADIDSFWPDLQRLSAFQLEHFVPMIPRTVKGIWEESLQGQDFMLKICGAGGGGFVLGFARTKEIAQNLSRQTQIVFPLD
jgi:mevalonate kinase